MIHLLMKFKIIINFKIFIINYYSFIKLNVIHIIINTIELVL